MKILFSITYYDPYISGLTICAKRLAEALVRRGRKVGVLCMQHDPRLANQETIAGVSVTRAKPLLAISKGFLSFDWIVQSIRLVGEADTIVINLPQVEGWIPAMIGKFLGKRIVAIYHCEVVLPEGFANSIIQSFVELANMATLLLADGVVTYTSDFAGNSRLLTLLRSFKKNIKIQTIYPPVPSPVVRVRVVASFKKKIGKADVVVGVAARLAAEKGIEYLFEALPQIKSQIPNPKSQKNPKSQIQKNELKIKIVIAGPMEPVGEEAYKRKIFSLVKKYHNEVVFLGEIVPEAMGSFYRLLDVLVLPSVNTTEAFGMVQVEAMLCGVPVVATNLPGVRVPVKTTGMGLIVPPGDAGALAGAIATVVARKADFVKPAAVIRRKFSLADTIASYLNVL